jgi:steroid delta-isomerase-like uncharacterized protein
VSEPNKNVIRQIEEAWNANQLDMLDQYFAPNFVQHSAMPGSTPSLATAKQAHQAGMQGFPDRKTSIEDIVADGDKVAVRIRLTGTNTGGLPFIGVPANGKPVDVQYISIYTLQDGKVTEHRAVMDIMGLMQQLGAIPSQG